MFKQRFFSQLLLCIFWIGCSSTGFDRSGMGRQLQSDGSVVTDAEIAKVLALKPQVKLPFRLGVYLDSGFRVYSSRYSWTESNSDMSEKKQLLAAIIGNKDIVSEAFFISEADVSITKERVSVKDIRLAAARYHADAVLILKSAYNYDTYPNFLSLLYFTIVGFWVAPGSHCDALFMLRGSLYDVRNEYLYVTAESEAVDSIIRPYALRECNVPLEVARKKAMESFSSEFTKRLGTLK